MLYLKLVSMIYNGGEMSISLVGEKKEIPCYQFNAYLYDKRRNINREFQSLAEAPILGWIIDAVTSAYGKDYPYLKGTIDGLAEQFGKLSAKMISALPYPLAGVDNTDFDYSVSISIVADSVNDIPGYLVKVEIEPTREMEGASFENEFQSLENTPIVAWVKKEFEKRYGSERADMLDNLLVDIQWATQTSSTYQLM